MGQLQRVYEVVTLENLPNNGTCTAETVGVRKEWGSLSKNERTSYINAVLCLRKLPPKTSKALVPGARYQWDDFVAAHINNALEIHWTVRGWSNLATTPADIEV